MFSTRYSHLHTCTVPSHFLIPSPPHPFTIRNATLRITAYGLRLTPHRCPRPPLTFSSHTQDDQKLPQIAKVFPMLQQGIGIHHSGYLPIIKEAIEILFQEGLLKVLFATGKGKERRESVKVISSEAWIEGSF